jgi:type VI secretion system protein
MASEARRKKSKVIIDAKARRAAGSLFERLVADEEDLDLPTDRDEINSITRSIKRHLIKLLNARLGGSAATPDLGVIDFNDGATESTDMVKHIAASINHCITEYEPRLSNVRVQHNMVPERPLSLQFTILASLSIRKNSEQIKIDLLMDDGNHTYIS